MIGMQSSKRLGGYDTQPSQPDTWEPRDSLYSGFSDMYYALQDIDNRCGPWGPCGHAYNAAFDFGFSCYARKLRQHWGGQFAYDGDHHGNTHLGNIGSAGLYDLDTVMELLLDGNQIKWYVNGELKKTETGLNMAKKAGWRKDTFEAPFWIVSVIGSPPDRNGGEPYPPSITNISFITAPGVPWQG